MTLGDFWVGFVGRSGVLGFPVVILSFLGRSGVLCCIIGETRVALGLGLRVLCGLWYFGFVLCVCFWLCVGLLCLGFRDFGFGLSLVGWFVCWIFDGFMICCCRGFSVSVGFGDLSGFVFVLMVGGCLLGLIVYFVIWIGIN